MLGLQRLVMLVKSHFSLVLQHRTHRNLAQLCTGILAKFDIDG